MFQTGALLVETNLQSVESQQIPLETIHQRAGLIIIQTAQSRRPTLRRGGLTFLRQMASRLIVEVLQVGFPHPDLPLIGCPFHGLSNMTTKWLFLTLFIALCNTPPLGASESVNIDKCGGFSSFKSSEYIDIAVFLQSMSKEKSIETLKSWADSGHYEMEVIILCRMLFEAKDDKPFRRPNLGAPVFCGSHEVESSASSQAFARFSLEPICIADGVPFLVVKTYIIGGAPQEKASNYLSYCIANTNWSTFKFKKKDAESLKKALENLIQTRFKDHELDKADYFFLHRQIVS